MNLCIVLHFLFCTVEINQKGNLWISKDLNISYERLLPDDKIITGNKVSQMAQRTLCAATFKNFTPQIHRPEQVSPKI